MKENATPPSRSPEALDRVLSGLDATMLAVGIVVGTGIFAVPGLVAAELGGPGPILLAWLAGGAVALAGALVYAELGSRFPRQGGGFHYVLVAFGPFAAFFLGWGSFLVGFPASSAVVASIFGSYFAAAAGGGAGLAKGAGLVALAGAWILNLRGTRFSATLQTVVTLTKLAAIGALAIAAVAAAGRWERLAAAPAAGWPGARAFVAALVGVLWTYDGWANLTVVAGEVFEPRRSLTRALLATVGIVTATYLLVNVGYLLVLPLEQLAGHESPASAAAQAALGPAGGRVLAGLVAVSAFGTLFGIAIAGPRYFWAMARAGLFFRAAGRLDPRTQAPRWGATALFVTSVAYLATGTFGQILSFYVAITLVYHTLSIASIFRLRASHPGRERAFRMPGYPLLPALLVAVGVWVTASEVAAAPVRNGIGLGVLALAAPAWLLWRRGHEPAVPGRDDPS